MPERKPFSLEAAREAAAKRWTEAAPAGGAEERNLSPDALAVHRFPVRLNAYELELMQLAADISMESKQRYVRRALRKACERDLRAANVSLPRRT